MSSEVISFEEYDSLRAQLAAAERRAETAEREAFERVTAIRLQIQEWIDYGVSRADMEAYLKSEAKEIEAAWGDSDRAWQCRLNAALNQAGAAEQRAETAERVIGEIKRELNLSLGGGQYKLYITRLAPVIALIRRYEDAKAQEVSG